MNAKTTFTIFLATLLALPCTAQWQRVTALPETPIYDLLVAGDTLYAAGSDRLFISRDAGISWDTSAIIHQEADEVTDLFAGNGVIYAGTVISGVYLSQDGGQNWQQHNTGLNGLDARTINMFARRGDYLYAATGGSGVFVKPLSPVQSSWTPFNTGLPWFTVESISNDNGTLLAGAGANATVSLRGPNDNEWNEVSFTVFNGDLNFFLGLIRRNEVLLGGGSYGLYRSTDDGQSWAHYNPGLGYIERVRFASRGGEVIALLRKITGSHLRVTADEGLNWTTFSSALPAGGLTFDLADYNGSLYVGRQNGLWRLSAPVPTGEPVAGPVILGQNFPNPVSGGSTQVPFTLRRTAHVQLSLYDLQGRLLHRTDAGHLAAGRHTLSIDLQNVVSGTYVYRLSADGQSTARTLQLAGG